jgi:hypothetical protein
VKLRGFCLAVACRFATDKRPVAPSMAAPAPQKLPFVPFAGVRIGPTWPGGLRSDGFWEQLREADDPFRRRASFEPSIGG